MIIPIGLEDNRLRRVPWVTFGIMILCTAVLLFTSYVVPSNPGRLTQELEEVFHYYVAHPYLQMPPGIHEWMKQAYGPEALPYLEQLGFPSPSGPANHADDEAEQAELNRLADRVLATAEHLPARRFGVVPARATPVDFITHMFLHGGWLHLIGNLFVLYLSGPFVEDVWGRLLFAGFYLLAGITAAGTHILEHPHSTMPMVGASGAIAGVMGAFLVRYWKTRIHFFYFGLIFRGTFWAPAWLVLLLWFSQQLLSVVFVHWTGMAEVAGIAFGAHIGGFVFGVVCALLIRHFRVEERYIHPGIESKIQTEVVSNPVVEQALDLNAAGDGEQAYELLSREHLRAPQNIDLGLALWEVALERGWTDRGAPVMLRVVHEELRQRQPELAIEHWQELRGQVPSIRTDPGILVRLARQFLEGGLEEDAMVTLGLAIRENSTGLTASLALRAADLARERDPGLAAEALEAALGAPDVSPAERARAEEIRARLSASGLSLRRASSDGG
jgi:membrane associated rhomboid family serine protease